MNKKELHLFLKKGNGNGIIISSIKMTSFNAKNTIIMQGHIVKAIKTASCLKPFFSVSLLVLIIDDKKGVALASGFYGCDKCRFVHDHKC